MWNKLKNRFQRFMIGRYGVDKFGLHILGFCIILNFLSLFFRRQSIFINLFADGLIFFELYRTFSRNYVKRSIENTRYLDFLTRVKRGWKVFRNNLTDRQYHYYLCPECAQIVRVPRGRGKISIHCPNCGRTFDRRS